MPSATPFTPCFHVRWQWSDAPAWVPTPNLWVSKTATNEGEATADAEAHARALRPDAPDAQVVIVDVTHVTERNPRAWNDRAFYPKVAHRD